jgi:hypothetical protein
LSLIGRSRYSPLLWAGQPNIIAIARRAGAVFLLTVAAQRNSNGVDTMLTVTARLQGSVYVVRDDTEGAPVVYQIDGWHQDTHPIYWPTATSEQGMSLEAELFGGHLSNRGASVMRTLRASGAAMGDFRGCRTYVDLGVAAELGVALEYPLKDHGLTVAGGDDGWHVRVLMRIPAGRALPTVNGVSLAPDVSAEARAQHLEGEISANAIAAAEWVWYVTGVVVVDSTTASIVLLDAKNGGGWVDRLELMTHVTPQ